MSNAAPTVNPYQSPRSVGANDGTLTGLDRALAVSAIVISTLFAVVVLSTRDAVPQFLEQIGERLS